MDGEPEVQEGAMAGPAPDLPTVGWLAIEGKGRFRHPSGDRAYLYFSNGVILAVKIVATPEGEQWYIVDGANVSMELEERRQKADGCTL